MRLIQKKTLKSIKIEILHYEDKFPSYEDKFPLYEDKFPSYEDKFPQEIMLRNEENYLLTEEILLCKQFFYQRTNSFVIYLQQKLFYTENIVYSNCYLLCLTIFLIYHLYLLNDLIFPVNNALNQIWLFYQHILNYQD